jgi:hypothetical protein
MIFLTEISVPIRVIRDTALRIDPLVASDPGYAAKTWLSQFPAVAPRPWAGFPAGDILRIIGWRSEKPDLPDRPAYAGYRSMVLETGEEMALTGSVVALRRIRHERIFDAAEGRDDKAAAYKAWLDERLIDTVPFLEIRSCAVIGHARRRVLRKAARRPEGLKIVKTELIPVVTAELTILVKDPIAATNWLLKGVGPQKAFGFGAFMPC